MNHQTLCELNGYLFCLLLPWCTASTICDIAHTSHLSLQIPPPEKKQQLWALLSLLCATWWCSLKSMNEDISGAVYAEQSHLGLTLPPSLRPQHPPPPPLFPPPPLPGWLVFFGFFSPLHHSEASLFPSTSHPSLTAAAPPALQAFSSRRYP